MSLVGRLLAAVVALCVLAGTPAWATSDAELWEAMELDRPARSLEAPGFSLSDLDGQRTGLDAFKDRVILLYFWTTW
jgi:cytochrome oxidase Cu insertion factor (SCO1/SenC/PrrC family)